jgi:hypothetical protein
MEGVVLGHRLGIEGRTAPQGVAVGDALAEFPQIPGLDSLEHEGAENLSGAQAIAPGPTALEASDEIVVDGGHELVVRIEKVGEGVQGRVQRDALGLQFEIREAEGSGQWPHRARGRRCVSRNAR